MTRRTSSESFRNWLTGALNRIRTTLGAQSPVAPPLGTIVLQLDPQTPLGESHGPPATSPPMRLLFGSYARPCAALRQEAEWRAQLFGPIASERAGPREWSSDCCGVGARELARWKHGWPPERGGHCGERRPGSQNSGAGWLWALEAGFLDLCRVEKGRDARGGGVRELASGESIAEGDGKPPGCLAIMQQGDTTIKPVLQVINIRPITTGNSPPRYRLLMSDGVNTLSSFMLATQLNPLVEEERLSSNCICQINRFIVNTLKDGRRVVILMELEILKSAEAVGMKLGNPVPYNEGLGQQQQQVVSTPVAASIPPGSKPQPQNGSAGMASTVPKACGASKTFGKAASTSLVSTAGGTQASKVVPIASLTPYQSRWTICARVTNKSQIRTWSNSRGEGKLFSIEVVDESGEIRATAFNEQVDKFFPLIDVNKVYYFSKGTLKIANKKFSTSKNDYEMTFNNDTSVLPCEDDHHLPTVQFDFTGIGDLENKPKDSIVDIIGICKSYEDATKVIVKSNNREVSKRNIYLMDTSGMVVSATLWGEDADRFDGSRQPVMAIKGARLSDFGGRSLSVLSSSTVIVNPDIPEAYKLRGWFDSEGQALDGVSISDLKSGGAGGSNTNWKTLYEVKSENLGQGDKPDYFSCVATVVYLRKENCMYQACPTQDCNKKVIDQQNGLYRCEKCDSEFPNFKYRMILSVNIADFLENQWVTCFQESAETVLGQSTAYLGELKEKNEQAFDEAFQNANFRSFTFRIRVKLETYNDESRIKASVTDVKPVDHREYGRRLIANIRKNAMQ
ncbi:PREDICTED: replication protein A 70 kDa DNA-binding subunit [Elephantulus edwardii]|uniref:replication protein A 70 kDa DNA-binding subunit n=1 Tax=Elephantulus edwardii TaxID=28737 RepID=UPI0003F06B94|nr:PREDICTED: replication protein A 70 kDa DNA-binding subunit [Elephantulus edwardii]